uniref:Uncharacterized protein n=1 Tax=Magallana gigas TaxID=29159 RepID=K1Q9L7_MAGGI
MSTCTYVSYYVLLNIFVKSLAEIELRWSLEVIPHKVSVHPKINIMKSPTLRPEPLILRP